LFTGLSVGKNVVVEYHASGVSYPEGRDHQTVGRDSSGYRTPRSVKKYSPRSGEP